jgi:hypothetical protein
MPSPLSPPECEARGRLKGQIRKFHSAVKACPTIEKLDGGYDLDLARRQLAKAAEARKNAAATVKLLESMNELSADTTQLLKPTRKTLVIATNTLRELHEEVNVRRNIQTAA